MINGILIELSNSTASLFKCFAHRAWCSFALRTSNGATAGGGALPRRGRRSRGLSGGLSMFSMGGSPRWPASIFRLSPFT